jgi:hypothetical protein
VPESLRAAPWTNFSANHKHAFYRHPKFPLAKQFLSAPEIHLLSVAEIQFLSGTEILFL